MSTLKSPKQLEAEVSQLLARTGAEPYWPGGDGGGGSGRRRSGQTPVVRPHTRTSPMCTRCAQYHTTAEHERHIRGTVKLGAHAKVRAKAKAKAKAKTKTKTKTKKKAKTRTKVKTRAKVKTKAKAKAKVKARVKTKAGSSRTKTTPRSSPPVASPHRGNPVFSLAQVDEDRHDRELAALVKRAMDKIGPEGRFGWKVFISEIWRALRSYDSMNLDEFKTRLLRLNRKGLVVLARADLVGAMDPAKVAASEIRDRGATFHFVVDQKEFNFPS